MNEQLLHDATGFQWDAGNSSKSWLKHGVRPTECEELFFNRPLLLLADEKHSGAEARHHALGHTDAGRQLFVVFTLRHGLVRVISARGMNKKERRIYEQA